MRYHGAIFDLDGTLLDTLDDLADSMNEVLAAEGMPVHPVAAYRFFIGTGLKNLVKNAAPAGTSQELLERLPLRMGEVYGRKWAEKTRPYPGIMDMLSSLAAKGIKLGILSNKPDEFTQVIARRFFPTGMFLSVRGLTPEVPRKPDPAGAFLVAEKLGIKPANMLYAGDSGTDMETGLAAGMFTVGVKWGFRPETELRAAGATTLVSRPEEILAFFEQ